MKKKQPIQVTLPRVAPAKKPARKAKPAKEPAARPIPPPMIRLRLPSEKPTREDGVYAVCKTPSNKTLVLSWPIILPFNDMVTYWFSLPDGILPREPSQEERWRAEFEVLFSKAYDMAKINGEFIRPHTFAAWEGFLAAKEGGAE